MVLRDIQGVKSFSSSGNDLGAQCGRVFPFPHSQVFVAVVGKPVELRLFTIGVGPGAVFL